MPAKPANGSANKTRGQSSKPVVEAIEEDSSVVLAPETTVNHDYRTEWQRESEFARSTFATEDPMVQMGPLSEVLGKAQKAYSSYLDAQKEVAKAYKVNEIQLEKGYKEAEYQANRVYEDTIVRIMEVRQEAELQAEESHNQSIEQAMQVLHDAEAAYTAELQHIKGNSEASMKESLKVRNDAVQKAWELRSRTIDRSWEIFLKETGG